MALSRDRRQTRGLNSPGARDIAVEALRGGQEQGRFAQDRLDRLIADRRPSAVDAALATELTLGVVRHRLTLDHLISRGFHGRVHRLDPGLLAVLRVGVYQIVWLDRIPAFAAVDSAVEQGKQIAGRRAGGLVNAVLRRLLRDRLDEVLSEPPDQPRRCVRVGVARWRAFDTDLFGDPETDPVGYVSASTSHPAVLVRRWLAHFGRPQTEQICLAGGQRPPLVLRVNQRRIDVQALLERLASEGTVAVAGLSGGSVFVAEGPPARQIPAVAEGLCQPQDVTPQAPVRASPPAPGHKVLDLCAGLGTKTTQLAEHMDDQGLILACDRSAGKVGSIDETCRRMGVSCVETVLADALDDAAVRHGPFDLALVDVPCSNSGVLARRPGARYRITPKRLSGLAAAQRHLLDQAARFVRPGSRIVYSTCSIEPEENEQVVASFLTHVTGWRLVDSRLTLPQVGRQLTDWRDGGFFAVMARS